MAKEANRFADRLLTTDAESTIVERRLEDAIRRFYGTRDAYEQAKLSAGIAEAHAYNFERAAVVLQPRQLQMAVACRDPQYTEIALGGAKGPGKSFFVIAQAGLDDCWRFPGLKVLYLRKIGATAKDQLHDLVLSVLAHFPDKEVTNERIQFGNDSRIVIGGFKDDNEALKYAGLEYDLLIIEEATQLSERTHKTLRLSLRSSKIFDGIPWTPKEYLTANPLGIGHVWFKKRYVDNERAAEQQAAEAAINAPPKVKKYVSHRKFVFSTVKDNKAVNPVYLANLKEMTGAERDAFLDGNWDVSAGAYFDTWHYNTHVIKPIRDVSWMRMLWMSMDYGFHHPNVAHLHGEDGDGNTYTLDELVHRKMHPHQIAPAIHAMLARYGLTRRDLAYFLVGTDVFRQTGGMEQTVAEQYQQAGIYVSAADTSPGSRVAGAHHMAALLGDRRYGIPARWFITTNCERLIATLPYLERNPNNSEDVLKVDANSEGEGGDDAYDSSRYGIHRPHVTHIS